MYNPLPVSAPSLEPPSKADYKIIRFKEAIGNDGQPLVDHSLLVPHLSDSDYSIVITPEGRTFISEAKDKGQGNKTLDPNTNKATNPGVLRRFAEPDRYVLNEELGLGNDSLVNIVTDQSIEATNSKHTPSRVLTFLGKIFPPLGKILEQKNIKFPPQAIVKWIGEGRAKELRKESGETMLSGNDLLILFESTRSVFLRNSIRLPKCYGSAPDRVYMEYVKGTNLHSLITNIIFLNGDREPNPGIELFSRMERKLAEIQEEVKAEIIRTLASSNIEETRTQEHNHADELVFADQKGGKQVYLQLDFAPTSEDSGRQGRFRNWIITDDKKLQSRLKALVSTENYEDAQELILQNSVCVDPFYGTIFDLRPQ